MDYTILCKQLSSLTENVEYSISNLANAAALLYANLEDINWAGFYLLEEEQLLLGPFQGKTACTRIPLGKGVCGTAAQRDKTVVVEDVHLFEGYIACDSASASEIVIPLHKADRVVGVLDIDSPRPDRFSPEDKAGLEQFAKILETVI